MKEQIKQQWIAALRSGSYQQGRSCLRNRNDEYCCLGVLCDLLNPSLWSQPDRRFDWDHDKESDMPSLSVQNLSGLDDLQCAILGEMNDSGQPFSEIADYIEAKI